MANCNRREPGCTGTRARGRTACAVCLAARAAREQARRAERRQLGQCVVCGEPAAEVAGVTLSTCPRHREYYNGRRKSA